MRARIVKAILWGLAAIGLTVVILRIIHGLGSVVALTDIIPWGLWKGGGVVALVPVGGAGFTLAALVYVFRWKRYTPLATGAVLLGLICYSSVALGLTFDIGVWWRIVFPIAFWNFHSTLFEIAWCIMLYLGVLSIEFSHAILEHFRMHRLLRVLEKVSIVFVIFGIGLSTLHQSSLGTLFLATPFRLHPLWYTDLLPLFFFMTSIGLGCLTITWATLAAHWIYRAKAPMDPINGLGRIAFGFLGAYLVIRIGEILVAGEAGLMFTSGWNSFNFWLEILLSAIIPVSLLWSRNLRSSPRAMFWISTSALAGISLNRVNAAGLATLTATNASYFPAWTEWVVTLGILSAAGLVYLFFVERIGIFSSIDRDAIETNYAIRQVDHSSWQTVFFATPLSSVRLYSAVFVFAVGAAMAWMPENALYGVTPEPSPVAPLRMVETARFDANREGARLILQNDGAPPPDPSRDLNQVLRVAMLFDGNQNGDYVLFDHDAHIARGGNQQSCARCHHMNRPMEKASRCAGCHSDMYATVSIFNHALHTTALGGNNGCARCHTESNLPKRLENTVSCETCHKDMRVPGALIAANSKTITPFALGYKNAMHGLCVNCHLEQQPHLTVPDENFSRCDFCHQGAEAANETVWRTRLQRTPGYGE